MASRKLTQEQRDTLRAEIRDRVAAGDRMAAIVAEEAAKYSLSPFTVRWHVKKAVSPGGAPVRHRTRPGRPPGPKPAGGSKDRALLNLKAEFDRLLEKDLEIRRAHIENLNQLQEINLRISERLIQGLEAVKRREFSALPSKKEFVKSASGFVSFGKRIRNLRKAAGWSLEEVARRVGTNKSYVSGMETGRVAPPSPKLAAKFAQAFSVDEKELLRLSLVEKAPAALRNELLAAFWPKGDAAS